MKILLTLEEYAKNEKISISAVRKQVASNSHKILINGKITYILEDDTRLKKLTQTIKNKNSHIRELKLKLQVQNNSNDERYTSELIKQISKLEEELEKREIKHEKKLKKKENKIDKLQEQKDKEIAKLQKEQSGLYEKFLGELFKTKVLT